MIIISYRYHTLTGQPFAEPGTTLLVLHAAAVSAEDLRPGYIWRTIHRSAWLGSRVLLGRGSLVRGDVLYTDSHFSMAARSYLPQTNS